jgi:hypothetical protein
MGPDERRVVYERLWLELTIAGRAVWSDPGLSETEKLDGLKWLNEIQHRVWGAHQSPAHYAASDLVANVQAHAGNAPHIIGHVHASLQNAIRHTTD